MVGATAAQAVHRDLFGGAVSAAVPTCFADISRIREVPDNQEVFAHAETDRSIIFELLQMEEGLPQGDAAAARFHFAGLSRDAQATDVQVLQAQDLPPDHFPLLIAADADPRARVSVVYGVHRVSKFREGAELANLVNVSLACVRLPRAATDLLLVYNDPIALHPLGSSAQLGSQVAEPDMQNAVARAGVLHEALRSLKVKDWSLFI